MGTLSSPTSTESATVVSMFSIVAGGAKSVVVEDMFMFICSILVDSVVAVSSNVVRGAHRPVVSTIA